MTIAITFWGTQKYLNFFSNWYDSIENNFIPDVDKKYFVFTDGKFEGEVPENIKVVNIPHYGFPDTFFKTFEKLLEIESECKDCEWLITIDADMIVHDKVTFEEFFGYDDTKKYLGVHHPCHYLKMSPHDRLPGCFDTNKKSNACVEPGMDLSIYWQTCLWGGKVPYIFDMMRQIDFWTKDDLSKSVTSRFYEESYINKFYILNKNEVITLGPEFAFPESFERFCSFPKKIVHISKDNKQYHENPEW
jgi:hypothetical protein